MKHTTKTLLSIAIIAALPFTANATQTIVETNTPAAVGANGTVKKAAATGPYQTATIGEHDDEHIATTAYVKGAYNDAIAAVNKVDDDKQVKLIDYYHDEPSVSNYVLTGMSASHSEGMNMMLYGADADDIQAMADDMELEIAHTVSGGESDRILVSLGGVLKLIGGAGMALKDEIIPDAIDSKRVQIYTTWGNDTSAATTLVPFATAPQQ